ncbi:MAG: N-acetylmuramoyl-L-alanine amidase family protein [Actinomycetota bacterium]
MAAVLPPPGRSRGGVASSGLAMVGASGAALASSPGGPPIGRMAPGVALPFDRVSGDWLRVLTPCEAVAWLARNAARIHPPTPVVLDPGHGGDEPGAVGPAALTEKEVNLEVARRAVDALGAQGVEAVLTRDGDYRATLAFRVSLATSVRPDAFVSIHHNAEPDGPRDGPGSETYYQYRSPASKRLAGLLYEETVAALRAFSASWVADRDAGAKWRLNAEGGDYYGILRRAGEKNLTASLAELAFISNASEEALLGTREVRQAEGEALARGIVRFLRTQDPGSGFTVPYPRTQPAGPGGGRKGCVDPLQR